MTEENQDFRDPTQITKWTTISLYAQIAITVVAIISCIMEYQLLVAYRDGYYNSFQPLFIVDAEENDSRQKIIGILYFIVLAISGVLILVWTYLSNYNAHQLGAKGMKFTPSWAIGWYFIPIANLWKPYQAMRELWKASSSPLTWNSQPISSLITWWWILWIAYNVSGNASLRLTMQADKIHELIVSNIVTVLFYVIALPLCLVLISIITKVNYFQTHGAGAPNKENNKNPASLIDSSTQHKYNVASKPKTNKYNKALTAYNYRKEIREAYDEIKDLPIRSKLEFLKIIEGNPQISSGQLIATIKCNHEKWLNPYESEKINNALNIVRKINPESEPDFRGVVDVLGDSADIEDVIRKIKIKEEIKEEDHTYYLKKIYNECGVFNLDKLLRLLNIEVVQDLIQRKYIYNKKVYYYYIEAIKVAINDRNNSRKSNIISFTDLIHVASDDQV